jgi:hypothetical protein
MKTCMLILPRQQVELVEESSLVWSDLVEEEQEISKLIPRSFTLPTHDTMISTDNTDNTDNTWTVRLLDCIVFSSQPTGDTLNDNGSTTNMHGGTSGCHLSQ